MARTSRATDTSSRPAGEHDPSSTGRRDGVGALTGDESLESVPAMPKRRRATSTKLAGKKNAAAGMASIDGVDGATAIHLIADSGATAKKALANEAVTNKLTGTEAMVKKVAARKAVPKDAVANTVAGKNSSAKKVAAKKATVKKATTKSATTKSATAKGATTKNATAQNATAEKAPADHRASSGSAAAHGSTAAGGREAGQPVHVPGEKLASLQAEYLTRLQKLMSTSGSPHPADRRFSSNAWSQGPFAWTASLYLINEEFMRRLAGSVVGGDAKTRERIQFATDQWLAAISPANFLLTNPEAQQRIVETAGESLRTGIGNLFSDLQRGRISQSDEDAFETGVNIATTPGSVVFENDVMQLIQFEPSTETVGSRPLLMVPPCINKYYILDLQPDNSLIAYTVAQGHTVFVVSWKNIQEDQGQLTWDDYLARGVIEPIRVVREITNNRKINVLGFCVGGTLLVNAAAVLAARKESWIESMTLLTSFIDFSRPGSIGVFIDEHQVAYRESTIGSGGIMPGRELALTFNYLRPNDLVWNYVVSNYLKGEAPPAFDMLYWNSDSTNLPGPMYCWYLRHMYLQNELREPGRLVCLDEPVDVSTIDVPTYIYASREDHIVPWEAAYESTQLLTGPLRFVLGASGHIAGVINPPARGKRSHWLGEDLPKQADEWFAVASERPGSWWPDWAHWLSSFAGQEQPAPLEPGSPRYEAIEPAPGRYVKEKAE